MLCYKPTSSAIGSIALEHEGDMVVEAHPYSSTPSAMSARFTLRAKALSFSLFFTELTGTSASFFDGRTRVTAVMKPTNSSTARMALSIRLLRSTPR